MSLNIGAAFTSARETFGTYLKKFVIPLAVGIGVIAVLCSLLPTSISKFLQ